MKNPVITQLDATVQKAEALALATAKQAAIVQLEKEVRATNRDVLADGLGDCVVESLDAAGFYPSYSRLWNEMEFQKVFDYVLANIYR